MAFLWDVELQQYFDYSFVFALFSISNGISISNLKLAVLTGANQCTALYEHRLRYLLNKQNYIEIEREMH